MACYGHVESLYAAGCVLCFEAPKFACVTGGNCTGVYMTWLLHVVQVPCVIDESAHACAIASRFTCTARGLPVPLVCEHDPYCSSTGGWVLLQWASGVVRLALLIFFLPLLG